MQRPAPPTSRRSGPRRKGAAMSQHPDHPETPPLPPELARLSPGTPLRPARLSRAAPTTFDLVPEAQFREALAGHLGLSRLRKLRFRGRLVPAENGAWELAAELGATVVQPCRVTLEPVTTRIDEQVRRRFVPGLDPVAEEEAEIPEDVDTEPLPEVIDPAAVMVEALALAIPPFPRADTAAPGDIAVSEPGTEPMGEGDIKPFSELAKLRGRLKE